MGGRASQSPLSPSTVSVAVGGDSWVSDIILTVGIDSFTLRKREALMQGYPSANISLSRLQYVNSVQEGRELENTINDHTTRLCVYKNMTYNLPPVQVP